MDSLIGFFSSGISYIGPFILLMGTLVFIHEMGHFLMAKYFGVRVEVFSLGFGKTLYQFTRGETTYKLCLVPLGGYVKMFGDDPTAEVNEQDQEGSFLHKSVWKRIAIVLAGPMMNFFIAIPIFALILVIGHKTPSSQLGDVQSGTLAYESGFRSGDKISQVNQREIQSWEQLDKVITNSAEKTLRFGVISSGGEQKQIKVDIPKVENDKLFRLSGHIGKIDGFEPISKSSLVGIKSGSIAHQSGLKSMDQILSINEDQVSYWRDIDPLLIKHQNSEITLKVKQYSPEGDLPERSVTLKSNYAINGGSLVDSLGIEKTSGYILGTVEESPAAQAGLTKGDKIVAINGAPVSSWLDILNTIKNFKEGDQKIDFLVTNSDPALGRAESPQLISVTPRMTELMNHKMQDEKRFTVGIFSDSTYESNKLTVIQSYNPLRALKYGFDETINWTRIISVGLYKMITNQVSTRNITGVITIGKIAGDSYKMGFDFFLKIMGLISVNLFLLNLLPIPVLDGGHLVFYTIEVIKGSPLSVKKMQMAQQVGFLLLISLMLFSFYNDIKNLIDPPF